MTTMTKTPTPTMTSAVPQRSGFQAIPTRIRDVRDPHVLPARRYGARERSSTLRSASRTLSSSGALLILPRRCGA